MYGGVAGVLYAGLIRFVAPDTFNIANMFLLLAMVIIGGRQSLVGCVVGAVGLSLVREQLVDYPTYAQLGFGIVVVLMVVFAPTGLAGIPARVRGALARRRGSAGRAELRPFQPYDPSSGPRPTPPSRRCCEVRQVSKQFRGLRALKDVSLTVRPRRDPGHRRAQRLGQDHAVQRGQRVLPGLGGPGRASPGGPSPAPARTGSPCSASPAPSRTCGCSPT